MTFGEIHQNSSEVLTLGDPVSSHRCLRRYFICGIDNPSRRVTRYRSLTIGSRVCYPTWNPLPRDSLTHILFFSVFPIFYHVPLWSVTLNYPPSPGSVGPTSTKILFTYLWWRGVASRVKHSSSSRGPRNQKGLGAGGIGERVECNRSPGRESFNRDSSPGSGLLKTLSLILLCDNLAWNIEDGFGFSWTLETGPRGRTPVVGTT